jgi:hypothetical protein
MLAIGLTFALVSRTAVLFNGFSSLSRLRRLDFFGVFDWIVGVGVEESISPIWLFKVLFKIARFRGVLLDSSWNSGNIVRQVGDLSIVMLIISATAYKEFLIKHIL